MDFGRIQDLTGVDFSLPEDPETTTRHLAKLPPRDGTPTLRLGTPRWADKGYLGKIYPRGTKPPEFLANYAESFQTIELNSTYYGVDEAAIGRWREAVGDEFRFCAKLGKAITHDTRLREPGLVTTFCEQIRGLGDRLGPLWALLPESFGPDSFQDLARFVRTFPSDLRLGVELRHPAWFGTTDAARSVVDLFANHRTIALITDVAGRRDVLHQRITSDTVLVRFVGNRLHDSDYARLTEWAQRLKRWFDQGLETVYFFLHQPEEHLTVELAEHFAAEVEAHCGLDLPRPRRVANPQQGTLF